VGVRLALLGELRLAVDGIDVPPLSPKARALVATLALRRGEAVSVALLNEELWPNLAPESARRVVQVRVAEVRKLLSRFSAADVLESVPSGYRLTIDPDGFDVECFARLLEEAERRRQAGDLARTIAALRAAVALWRGPALADAQGSPFLEAEAAELEESRLSAVEDRVDAELLDGGHHRLVPELGSLVAAHPLREGLWVQLVTALYRSGRQAEALRACTAARRMLAEEVGLEPGPALRAVEEAVRAQDPALSWSPPS
jgi:DNA-binding SARP family transcriptional activator